MVKILEKDYLLDKYNKHTGAYTNKFFTVFRIGDAFKNDPNASNLDIKGLEGFDRHNNRKTKVKNVDETKSKYNKILIGSENVKQDVMKYLEGVKLRDNSVIAKELVLSGGNGFWELLSDVDRKKWVDVNVKFLKDNFGDNCVYAVLHLDEQTPHLHALIVPKFYNEKRKIYTLNNGKYFDGREKLSAWQDKYTEAVTKDFQNIFRRGIKGSKAKHIDLKTFYNLINEKLDTSNIESIKAYAKENHLNRKKLKSLKSWLMKMKQQLKLVAG